MYFYHFFKVFTADRNKNKLQPELVQELDLFLRRINAYLSHGFEPWPYWIGINLHSGPCYSVWIGWCKIIKRFAKILHDSWIWLKLIVQFSPILLRIHSHCKYISLQIPSFGLGALWEDSVQNTQTLREWKLSIVQPATGIMLQTEA